MSIYLDGTRYSGKLWFNLIGGISLTVMQMVRVAICYYDCHGFKVAKPIQGRVKTLSVPSYLVGYHCTLGGEANRH